MAASSDYQYWTDRSGLVRTHNGKASSLSYKTSQWKDWDYSNEYANTGDWKWELDFRKLSREEAERFAKSEYGIDLPA